MNNFITVRCADGVDVLVNIDDISSVKPARVYVDKSSSRTVSGWAPQPGKERGAGGRWTASIQPEGRTAPL